MIKNKNDVIILAAGNSQRFRDKQKKQNKKKNECQKKRSTCIQRCCFFRSSMHQPLLSTTLKTKKIHIMQLIERNWDATVPSERNETCVR